MENFNGYHSEWNLGSPGGWDYQRINQSIGKTIWEKYFKAQTELVLDFDHPWLIPVHGFVNMLVDVYRSRQGRNSGLIAIVAEEETLQDVTENQNLVHHLNAIDGLQAALMAPQELELKNGSVQWRGKDVALMFIDFNTNVLLELHRKHNLRPLLHAVKNGQVINPRGTEPINSKGLFEVLTDPRYFSRFPEEIIRRTPWTRQFYPRKTTGPNGEVINDLVEWTRLNWERLVLKPERGYSGKGVAVGGIHNNVDDIIERALKNGGYNDYIVQEKIPLSLWSELMPDMDPETGTIKLYQNQTDFRCLFGQDGLYGFLGRFGKVPTNVGSGGGVQPLAVLRSDQTVREATRIINEMILGTDPAIVRQAIEEQQRMALDQKFTYLLGPIKIALRPRLITLEQMKALENYSRGIWESCLTLEQMWLSEELEIIICIEPEELEIIRSQPWLGSPAIFASDGLFSFGAHIE
ncbi:MAG: hypothetical protein ONB31_01460 [candidate division KSB1 bacterium]|nr:hypothetical protein [candidate division KSB1 bacterium]MDZ7334847.1 hypothetical protein [candidate division KSB1 bacterium]MDZ7357872.1 hypothetical protein [candidate division KSB1 bacterium]MDZ7400424.1 hypothetical protein [candidate division KSB1 bacterium]